MSDDAEQQVCFLVDNEQLHDRCVRLFCCRVQVLGQLKAVCGFEYTVKLQRMFHDIGASEDLTERFDAWLEQRANGVGAAAKALDNDVARPSHDASFLVLTWGAWPIRVPSTPFVPPPLVARSERLFAAFYAGLHHGRRLTWLYHMSKADVKTNCFKRRYELQCGSYHLAVLLLLNEAREICVDDVVSASSLPREVACSTIQTLLDIKLVKALASSSADDNNNNNDDDGSSSMSKKRSVAVEKLPNDTKFRINTNFVNKRLRIKLGTAVARETAQEASSTRDSVKADRNLYLRALIVRVMKARRRLSHQQLIAEVLQQAAERFNPSVVLVKKCIESLIEQDFLERDPNETKMYNYLA